MKTTKRYTLALILLFIASSAIWIESASSQSTPKPAVPEFTLKFVFDSYYVPPTYTTDPYTGKSVIDEEGRHEQNNTLQISIRNQLFTSQINSSGNSTSLYYAVAFKGHYEEKWEYIPYNAMEKGSISDGPMTNMHGGSFINASRSEFTVIPLNNWRSDNIPDGGQIDVMVQALIGHDNMVDWGPSFIGGGDWVTYYFEGASSDWSNTQTIKVGTDEKSTQSVAILELNWEQIVIAVMAVAIAVLAVGLAFVWRKLPRK